MMNILISGIHGFVGSNLVATTKNRHQLFGIDIIVPHQEGVVKTYAWNDLTNHNLPEVEVIIHLAGKAHDTKNQADANTYFQVNTELTRIIYDYFLQSTAKTFVFFSSVKAAADKVDGAVLTEEVVPSPKGPYGESKIAAEKLILENIPADKKVIILRPAMIHGPGNKGNLNLLYSVVRKGIPWPLGLFENRRSFTSIDNLSYVVDQLLAKDVPSGIYNMCDDEALSTNELIQLMCDVLEKKAHIWKIPKDLMKGTARLCGSLHLPLNPERLHKLTENYVVSNEKIKQALGIEKMPVTAVEGFCKTLLSFEK